MDFGQNLKLLREQRQLTQTNVADKLYVSRKTISSWENGRSYPDIATLVKLSTIYQISLDKLLKEDLSMVNHYQQQSITSNQDFKIVKISYYLNCGLLLLIYLTKIIEWHKLDAVFISILVINLAVLVTHYHDYERWINSPQQLTKIIVSILMILVLNYLFFHTLASAPARFTGIGEQDYLTGYIVGKAVRIITISGSLLFIFFGKPRNK